MSPHAPARWVLLLSAVSLCAGCNLTQGGINPVSATLNFPIALALSPTEAATDEAEWLYVVNSNCDLRFNEGTLMAFNLVRLDEILSEEGCSEAMPCVITDLAGTNLLSDEVGIGSHADGVAVSPGGGRLYIPSRSNRNLTFVDWVGTRFECGETRDEGSDEVPRCGDAFRAGADGGVTSERELSVDGDPVAVAVTRLGGVDSDLVLLALREGRVALFVDQAVGGGETAPVLTHIAEGFPDSVVTLTMQPGTAIGWMTSALTRDFGRVGIAFDAAAPERSFLYDAGSRRLTALDDGQDSRDLQFDPTAPLERAFVLLRRPESVATVDLVEPGINAGDLGLVGVDEVGAGPSRLAMAEIDGSTYALTTSFDARKLFVVDVTQNASNGLVAVLGGFSGPFELVVDAARELLYVADFSVSVIRVIDLAPLADNDPPVMIATIGQPTPVESFAE